MPVVILVFHLKYSEVPRVVPVNKRVEFPCNKARARAHTHTETWALFIIADEYYSKILDIRSFPFFCSFVCVLCNEGSATVLKFLSSISAALSNPGRTAVT